MNVESNLFIVIHLTEVLHPFPLSITFFSHSSFIISVPLKEDGSKFHCIKVIFSLHDHIDLKIPEWTIVVNFCINPLSRGSISRLPTLTRRDVYKILDRYQSERENDATHSHNKCGWLSGPISSVKIPEWRFDGNARLKGVKSTKTVMLGLGGCVASRLAKFGDESHSICYRCPLETNNSLKSSNPLEGGCSYRLGDTLE